MTRHDTMKATVISACGEPDVLQFLEVPKPRIERPNQVLVRLQAADVNPVDTKMRRGYLPISKFPAILGCGGAGIVAATGSAVQEFKTGAEVYFFHGGVGTLPGNYAEYAVLEDKYLVAKPPALNFVEAAAAPLVLITAWESLYDRAGIKAGQTVLVHAGAGGVGHVAVQVAKYAGARVFATVGSRQKADFVRSLGADSAILYKETDFVEEVMQLTGGSGVDIVMDNVGGPVFQASFPAVRHYGDIVTLLLPAQSTDWQIARMRNLRISLEIMSGPFLFGIEQRLHRQKEILQECSSLLNSGKIKIHVSRTYPLAQAAAAHRHIETGSATGKLVLTI